MNARPSWDDLRYFLAVARIGTLSGAAKQLGVNHTTVLRRIAGLEEALGSRLFDRSGSNHLLTPSGEELRETALRIEEEVASVELRVVGMDSRQSGHISITTVDILANVLLPPHVAAFHQSFPDIAVSLTSSETPHALTAREADIALRVTPGKPPAHLVGRMVSGMSFAVYGAADFLPAMDGEPPRLENYPWIGLGEQFNTLPMWKWVADRIPARNVRARVDTVNTLFSLTRGGCGLALIPCFLGDSAPELRRFTPPVPEISAKVWLLTHESLRHAGRIRAFLDFMWPRLSAERDRLEGKLPTET